MCHILARLAGGNSPADRGMISAVVGVQFFGGEALWHRPKTGGPRYLHRFASSRTVSIDTAAVGGNATQPSSQEQE